MVQTIILALVSAVVGLAVLYAALQFGVKLLSKKQSSGASDQITSIDKTINELNTSIEAALSKFSELVSGDELDTLEKTKIELNNNLKTIETKLKSLDQALANKQKDVEKAESTHNELKRSKEAAQVLADELKSAKSLLENEHKALESELTQSLTQLETLSSELKINPQAEAGINKIKNSLTNSRTQLNNLIQVYKQGSTRFVNLQAQYHDLEKEFTKLVEKELSGGK